MLNAITEMIITSGYAIIDEIVNCHRIHLFFLKCCEY